MNVATFAVIKAQVRLAKLDNATRSKHALNSCEVQNNWFKYDGLGKHHKNTYFPICQMFPTPDEYALCKDNFATGSGMNSCPPQAPLGVSQLSRKFEYH